jgi:hypothetical protein
VEGDNSVADQREEEDNGVADQKVEEDNDVVDQREEEEDNCLRDMSRGWSLEACRTHPHLVTPCLEEGEMMEEEN